MKSIKILSFIFVIVSLLLSGCKNEMNQAEQQKKPVDPGKLRTLRISVQPLYLSAQLQYILDHHLDEDKGLKLELVISDSGAEQIQEETMKKWDVATIGGAFVYPAADNEAIIIAEYISSNDCNNIYARKDSDVFKVKGFNPTYPNVYGDPNTVMGKDILMMPNTTSQYIAAKWLASIGVREDSVHIISGDFQENYERIDNGIGDFASLTAPYSLMAEEKGFKKIATASDLNIPFYEVLIANKAVYEAKKEEITAFIELILEVNDVLENDPALKKQNAIKWYKERETNIDDSYIKYIEKECELKHYVTAKDYSIESFGQFEEQYAQFLANNGAIKAEDLMHVKENLAKDIFSEALKNVYAE